MNRPSRSPDADESVLAGLIQTMTDALQRGETPDIASIAERHPHLAGELRELWAAAQIAEEMAKAADDTTEWPARGDRATSDSPAPDELAGLEILEELGRGGMGVVYRARQKSVGRVVAVKRLIRGDAASAIDFNRFVAEAAAIAKLSHPHIVVVHDVGIDDGQPFIAMQYVEGTTLARRLAAGPITSDEAARLLAPIARAVQHAHERGVLHRDLKPSNILIDRDGRPYLSDFGLAKRVEPDASLTPTGVIVGTPSYMAPEQATGGRGAIGPASDVYSLGAILYQMLTGRAPFLAASPLDTILLLLEQDPVPPRVLNPRAHPDLEMIALKCLQKPPELRYASAGALADDLDAFLAGEPVSARSTSLWALASRLLGETHHAPVLENWGFLWILHSLALIVFFGLTNWLAWRGVTARWPYVMIFTVGLGAWAAFFWSLRRRGGPITFVERQLAHVWGSGVLAINFTFLVEWLLGLPVLTLVPMFAVTNGMLFMVKGGILSGTFYVQAAAVFVSVIPMALFPKVAPMIFGLVAASCFFATGLKYHLRLRRALRIARVKADDTARP